MSIHEVRGFRVACDTCDGEYDDAEGYISLFDTEALARERIEAAGWIVTSGKVTCGDCLEDVGPDE